MQDGRLSVEAEGRALVGREALATFALVAVMVLAGVTLALGPVGPVAASLVLGLGFGLVTTATGRGAGVHANPAISLVVLVWRGEPLARVAWRLGGQLLGASAAAIALGLGPAGVVARLSVPAPAAAGVAAFGLLLVVIGVATRRDRRVPVAVGCFASASLWMGGQLAVGNPALIAVAAILTRADPARVGGSLLAVALGSLAAARLALFLFPRARESLASLVVRQRVSVGELMGRR